MELKGDERIDYLPDESLKIIQSPTVFSFSLDALLLGNFAYVPIQKGDLIDLCSGNGIIPILLTKRTNGNIVGVEIQEKLFDMAVRSVEINELQNKIEMIHGDLKDMPSHFGNKKFDVVTCNPPYFQSDHPDLLNENEHLAIARHEIYCTLEDVIRVSSKLVKQGGKVSLVHRPGRLLDIVTLMRKYNIEPKRMQLVYPKKNKEANTLLIEGIKDGKPDLKILAPLVVYDENDKYTMELKSIIYGNK